MKQVWEEVAAGHHVVVLGESTLEVPADERVFAVQVDCDSHRSVLGPLLEAHRRIAGALGEAPEAMAELAAEQAVAGLRRRILGERPQARPGSVLLGVFNRLADSSHAARPACLVLEGLDHVDENVLRTLVSLLEVEGRLRLPLVMTFASAVPPGEAASALVGTVRARGGAVVDAEPAAAAARATEPVVAVRVPGELEPEVRRVLRAGALVGQRFEAELVAELLELPALAVLELLQRAADAGVALEDLGESRFRLEPGLAAVLRDSLLPSLASAWHRRLARLLSPAPQGPAPALEGAGATPEPWLQSLAELQAPGSVSAERARRERLDASGPPRERRSARPAEPVSRAMPPSAWSQSPEPLHARAATATTDAAPPENRTATATADAAAPDDRAEAATANAAAPDDRAATATADAAAPHARAATATTVVAPPQNRTATATADAAAPHDRAATATAVVAPPQNRTATATADAAAPDGRAEAATAEAAPPENRAATTTTDATAPDDHAATATADVTAPHDHAATATTDATAPHDRAETATAVVAPPQNRTATATTDAAAPHDRAATAATDAAAPHDRAETAAADSPSRAATTHTAARAASAQTTPPEPSTPADAPPHRPTRTAQTTPPEPSTPASAPPDDTAPGERTRAPEPVARRATAPRARPQPRFDTHAATRLGLAPPAPPPPEPVSRRRRVVDDARAAEHALAAGQLDAAAQSFLSAAHQAALGGLYAAALELASRGLTLLERLPRTALRRQIRILLLAELGRIQWIAAGPGAQFTLAGALRSLEQARSLIQPDDPVELAVEITTLVAGVCYDAGDAASLERALAELAGASRALQAAGRPVDAARLLNDQAAVWVRLGDFPRANHLLQQSREVFAVNAPHDPQARAELAETHHLIARLTLHVDPRPGHEADAVAMGLHHARAAEEAYRELELPREAARVKETLARLELRGGDADAALDHLRDALDHQQQLGDAIGLARSTDAAAQALARRGDLRQAATLLQQSLELNLEKGSHQGLEANRDTLRAIAAATPSPQPDERRLLERLAALVERATTRPGA